MVEDCDLFTWLVYPKNESVSKLWHWYESIQVDRGTDPEISAVCAPYGTTLLRDFER